MSTSKWLADVERQFEQRQAVLAVPFVEKDRAADRGAVWHPTRKVWFVPTGVDVGLFKEWNLTENSLGPTVSDQTLIADFEKAMREFNLVIPEKGIIADGRWHNVKVNVKKWNKSGAYLLNLAGGHDGVPCGQMSNKITGERSPWRYDGALLTPEQRMKMREEARIREAQASREEKDRQDAAALHAQEIWASGVSAEGHGYAIKKGVEPLGIRQVSGAKLLEYEEFVGESGRSAIRRNLMYAIVPLMTERGEVRNIQAISPDGKVKSFMRGAQKAGLMFVLGAASFESVMNSVCPIVSYAEGWATTTTFRAGMHAPAVVCFDAGNMEAVVEKTAKLLPPETVKVL
ncbi:partial DNA primase TraC, partial [Rhodocyclaceae bacterium]